MEREVYRQLDELQDRHWWFVARRQLVDTVLTSIAPRKDLRILEAGCGTGGNLTMLAGHGDVCAFEPDAEARDMARAKAGHNVQEGYLPDRIPYGDGAFDVIVALDVIEHVEQDKASLIALRRKLARDGKLVITVPAFQFLWGRHDEVHHHYRRYQRRQLETLLCRAGYRLEHVTYCNTLLFPVVAGVRLLSKLFRFGDEGDVKMPSPAVNAILRMIFACERAWITRLSMPFGVSLMAVASSVD